MKQNPQPRPLRERLTRFARNAAFCLRLRRDRQRRRHVQVTAGALEEFSKTLQALYFRGDELYLASPEGRDDFEDHLRGRLEDDRRRVVPWLDGVRPLKGLRILEIGCGTGSSTVALAEQGARVLGLDIEPASLEVARARCALHGFEGIELVEANAVDEHEIFGRPQDLVLFHASLEHMLHQERIAALRRAWKMLPSGGLLAVLECPNRLWFFDGHTAQMPFFHWLPDELALDYAQFSPRRSLREAFREGDYGAMTSFLRRGRGVSFHEFRLALGELGAIAAGGRLESYLRRWYPLFLVRDLLAGRRGYRRLLRRLAPEVDRAFFEPSLNLVLRKA